MIILAMSSQQFYITYNYHLFLYFKYCKKSKSAVGGRYAKSLSLFLQFLRLRFLLVECFLQFLVLEHHLILLKIYSLCCFWFLLLQ